MKFNARPPVTKKAPSAWYMSGVNINYSFKTLERIASELGADVVEGDVLVVDNAKMDKRKAFKKTINGCVILYVSLLNNNKFVGFKNGKIGATDNKPLLDFFRA